VTLSSNAIWLGAGFGGQALFAARFLVQWLVSEKERRSVIPTVFWYLSLGGGLVLLVYALHLRDPVFITGQATGVFIYLRNLMLLRGARAEVLSRSEPSDHAHA
jgi:lipid-A-disaccharide synthase-like uncharacterized protein